MSDYLEREAAVRFLREKLADIAHKNPTVYCYLSYLRNERSLPVIEAVCELVRSLVEQNDALMRRNSELLQTKTFNDAVLWMFGKGKDE